MSAGMSHPVSLVFIVHGRKALTAMTLETALHDPLPEGSEVIVVNNHADDCGETEDFLYGVHFGITHLVLCRDNRGLAWAFNAGVGLARCPYIAVIENDVCFDPGWLAATQATYGAFVEESMALRRKPLLLLGLTNHDLDRYQRGKTPEYRVRPLGEHVVVPQIGVVAGSVYAHRRTYRAIGQRPGEGSEYGHTMPRYCRMAHEAGATVAYANDPVAYHIHPQNTTWQAAAREWGLDKDAYMTGVHKNQRVLAGG